MSCCSSVYLLNQSHTEPEVRLPSGEGLLRIHRGTSTSSSSGSPRRAWKTAGRRLQAGEQGEVIPEMEPPPPPRKEGASASGLLRGASLPKGRSSPSPSRWRLSIAVESFWKSLVFDCFHPIFFSTFPYGDSGERAQNYQTGRGVEWTEPPILLSPVRQE